MTRSLELKRSQGTMETNISCVEAEKETHVKDASHIEISKVEAVQAEIADQVIDEAIDEKRALLNKLDKLVKDKKKLKAKISRLKHKGKTADTIPKPVAKHKLEKSLKPYQAELIHLQKYLEEKNQRMIILFEGRDASGKGGTIRRVTRYMNEKHYRVVALGKPTEHQKTQWFFQKYISQFPRGGEMVLFDRSWYNRAMVEPVFNFCSKDEYKYFMKGVTGFEKDLVRQGTILLKLYFSVTKEEQAQRFKRRKSDSLRQWKLSEVDLQAQEQWDKFTNQKYGMLRKTHTSSAPWTVIRSNDKHQARLNAMRIILNAVPYKRLNKDLDFVPDSDIVISGAREVEQMEAERIKAGKFSQ